MQQDAFEPKGAGGRDCCVRGEDHDDHDGDEGLLCGDDDDDIESIFVSRWWSG